MPKSYRDSTSKSSSTAEDRSLPRNYIRLDSVPHDRHNNKPRRLPHILGAKGDPLGVGTSQRRTSSCDSFETLTSDKPAEAWSKIYDPGDPRFSGEDEHDSKVTGTNQGEQGDDYVKSVERVVEKDLVKNKRMQSNITAEIELRKKQMEDLKAEQIIINQILRELGELY